MDWRGVLVWAASCYDSSMQTQPSHIFVLFDAREPEKLDSSVIRAFAGRSYQVAPGQWLVRSETAQPAEIYKSLLNGEHHVSCIIMLMADYYGWHDKATWDWLEANQVGG